VVTVEACYKSTRPAVVRAARDASVSCKKHYAPERLTLWGAACLRRRSGAHGSILEIQLHGDIPAEPSAVLQVAFDS